MTERVSISSVREFFAAREEGGTIRRLAVADVFGPRIVSGYEKDGWFYFYHTEEGRYRKVKVQ